MRMIKNIKNRSGFTLIELFIGFALILMIAGFAVFPLLGYKNTEEFNTQEKILIAMIRDAQGRSIYRVEGYRWGIRFTNNEPGADTLQLFYGENPTGEVFGCNHKSSNNTTVTIVETRALKSSSNFTDPPVGCAKDIVFSPGTGIPNPMNDSGFQNKIVIVPNGFTSPDKTIVVQDNGRIGSCNEGDAETDCDI